ncbi:hypothetical protein QVD17_17289 [Tagetes erecta]|uniref:F-box domain-containing protein n=1 Tax=Tagetes erecta TaxID=13708 RepID=A0AAD8KTL5_TARER|nr:hypothetical protein QVD17_17289 [Tagetes erecta]
MVGDMISNLPQSIIEIILCLLPTKEAARTSILSREWMYRWTTIPKLAFIQDKILTLHPIVGSSPATDDSTTLIDLFGCLLMIENLSFCLRMMTDFTQGRVPMRLPVTLVELKCLCIRDACPPNQADRIPCLLLLMRSCPNLEKLKLKIYYIFRFRSWTDLSDMWFPHLNELEIEVWSKGTVRVFDFLRLVLAKSPVLKKVKILLRFKDEDVNLLRRCYSRYPHASPVVEIIVECGVGSKFDPF